jgi:hypothetical protein
LAPASSLLGEAGSVAGSAVWLSFLLAGIVSALLVYTVVKMGVSYPSSGGLIAYLIEGFGNGRLVGIASWLGYFAAIVIVCSMVAVSFGSYATSLFIGENAAAGWDNLFTTLIVVAMAGINIVGSKIVDRAQSLIVILLLAVFAVFIAVTLWDINWDLLAFSGYPSIRRHHRECRPSPSSRTSASASPSPSATCATRRELPKRDVSRPQRHDGAVRPDRARGVRDAHRPGGDRLRARRRSPRPRGRRWGRRFTMMAIAALLATSSSVNDALRLGGLTSMLAGAGFPPPFGRSRLARTRHALITAGIVLVVSNPSTSPRSRRWERAACSLVIFVLVGVAAYRRRADIGANALIVLAGIAATAVVLAFFAVDTLRNAPETFIAIVAITALAVVLDFIWKRSRRTPAADPGATAA